MSTLIQNIDFKTQPQRFVKLKPKYEQYFSGANGYVYTPQWGLTNFVTRYGSLLAGTYRLTQGYDNHGRSVRTNIPSNDEHSFDSIIPPFMIAGSPSGASTWPEGFTWVMVESPQEVYIPDSRLMANQWVNGHDFGGPAITAGIAFKSTGYYFENVCYAEGDTHQTGRAVYPIQRNPQQLYNMAATHKTGAAGYNSAFCNGVKLTPSVNDLSIGDVGRGRVEGIFPPAYNYERNPKLYMMAVSNRVVPDSLLRELSANPWSIFMSGKGDIYSLRALMKHFRRTPNNGVTGRRVANY